MHIPVNCISVNTVSAFMTKKNQLFIHILHISLYRCCLIALQSVLIEQTGTPDECNTRATKKIITRSNNYK